MMILGVMCISYFTPKSTEISNKIVYRKNDYDIKENLMKGNIYIKLNRMLWCILYKGDASHIITYKWVKFTPQLLLYFFYSGDHPWLRKKKKKWQS